MLKVMLFFSNLCVQVLNCFVHSIAEYHWVQTCFITTTTTSSRNLQKSREITAVLQKVSILEVESLSAFCAWHFCIRKKQTFISRLIKQSMFKSDELLLTTFNEFQCRISWFTKISGNPCRFTKLIFSELNNFLPLHFMHGFSRVYKKELSYTLNS